MKKEKSGTPATAEPAREKGIDLPSFASEKKKERYFPELKERGKRAALPRGRKKRNLAKAIDWKKKDSHSIDR